MFADAFLIQQRLGHEKVSTTLGTYAHLYPDRANNVADRLEALAFPGERNRDTGLILPRMLLFCCFGRKKAPPSSEKS